MVKLTPIVVAALALGLQGATVTAQERNRERLERPAQQQEADRDNPRGERPARPAMPLMRALDANGDGTIDAREISRATASLLTLDADGDGKLSPAEFRGNPRGPALEPGERREGREGGREGREARPDRERPDRERPQEDRAGDAQPRRGMLHPLLVALDTNKDGTLDADEIANASASLRKLDKNNDRKLTPDELRPQRPEGVTRDRDQPERQSPRGRPVQP